MSKAILSQHPALKHLDARLNAHQDQQQFYDGRICRRDKTTLRYVRDDFCVACAKRMQVREFYNA